MKLYIYYIFITILLSPAIGYAQFRGINAKSPNLDENNLDFKSLWLVSLTPDGDMQRALSEESITAVTGSLGLTATKFIKLKDSKNVSPNTQVGVFFTVESTNSVLEAEFDNNDKITNRRLFGSTILLPSTVGCLTEAFELNLQFFPFLKYNDTDDRTFEHIWKKMGFGGYFNSSSIAWKAADKTEIVLHNAGGVYIYNRALETESALDDANNHFVLTPYFGYTFRNLNGDIKNETDFRYNILGTNDLWFHGIEPGLQIVVNSLRTNIGIPIFLNNRVDGLNFGQIMITLGVSGNLVLTKKYN